MLQAVSLYCKHDPWKAGEMAGLMLDIANTSLKVISGDLDNPK